MGSNISSEEINYLIYRYLQEAGFLHASFAFGHESLIYKSSIKADAVPPGTLIALLQKGSHYIEIETHLCDDGSVRPCYKPFNLLEPHICDVSSLEESKATAGSTSLDSFPTLTLAPQENHAHNSNNHAHNNHASNGQGLSSLTVSSAMKKESNKKEEHRKKAVEKRKRESTSIDTKKNEEDMEKVSPSLAPGSGGAELAPSIGADSEASSSVAYRDVLESEVRTFSRHSREVFVCSWNPKKPVIASAAGDGLAFIWDTLSSDEEAILLDHREPGTELKSVDITTLDWHAMGSYLATGAYDGVARIWDDAGELIHTLRKHKEPIFSLKWNKRGNYLLTGSFDKTTIIWDAHNGDIKQLYDVHSGPILDADWKNNTTFASCSSDKMIHVCKLNEKRPIKSFIGHTEDINAIKWDPSATFLASGSDDKTAKLWDMNHESPIHDLIGHEKDVYTLEWSPTGPKSDNPNMDVYLATASFDHTAKIWQLETGQCTATLARHTYPVYSIAYSPNAQYIATGSFDKTVHIWSAKDGRPVRTFTGSSGVFDVCWNAAGDKLAVSTDHHKVHVIDFRY